MGDPLPNKRFYVPDLSPMERRELRGMRPRFIFVAESPHVSEVEPQATSDRRPLCGAAGRQWWAMLGDLLEHQSSSDVTLKRMLDLCRAHGVILMNAVQYPLDPKIAKFDPHAEPVRNLGFAKTAGVFSYRKRRSSSEVQRALKSLRSRLTRSGLDQIPIYCLGNDSEWFVTQALGKELAERRIQGKVPHPSAWWRRGDFFRKLAREKLSEIFLVGEGKPQRKG